MLIYLVYLCSFWRLFCLRWPDDSNFNFQSKPIISPWAYFRVSLFSEGFLFTKFLGLFSGGLIFGWTYFRKWRYLINAHFGLDFLRLILPLILFSLPPRYCKLASVLCHKIPQELGLSKAVFTEPFSCIARGKRLVIFQHFQSLLELLLHIRNHNWISLQVGTC